VVYRCEAKGTSQKAWPLSELGRSGVNGAKRTRLPFPASMLRHRCRCRSPAAFSFGRVQCSPIIPQHVERPKPRTLGATKNAKDHLLGCRRCPWLVSNDIDIHHTPAVGLRPATTDFWGVGERHTSVQIVRAPEGFTIGAPTDGDRLSHCVNIEHDGLIVTE
jgi:hypothetical protein